MRFAKMRYLKRVLAKVLFVVMLVGLLWQLELRAATYTIASVTGSQLPPGAVQARFNMSESQPLPPPDIVKDNTLWRVSIYLKSDTGRQEVVVPGIAMAVADPHYGSNGIVTIQTVAKYSLDPVANSSVLFVEISFLYGAGAATASFAAKPPKGSAPVEAPSPTSSQGSANSNGAPDQNGGAKCASSPGGTTGSQWNNNICLSGIWIPEIGRRPLYSSNSNIYLLHDSPVGYVGLRASEEADSAAVLDPNTFKTGIFDQYIISDHVHGILEGVLLNWDVLTTEFDRKKKNTNLGTNLNLITAPLLGFPLKAYHGIGFEFDAGIETGDNLKNNLDPNGFGFLFRGLLGAQAEKIFIKPWKFQSIKIASTYQVRLLAEPEVFTREIHGALKGFKGTQARNYVSTTFSFMFSKTFGVTLQHEYGALPPSYVLLDNRGTIGFTYQYASH